MNEDPLDLIPAVANDVGASEIAADATNLRTRIAAGLFYVACIGQFKRGKSTLINALIGAPLLPVGVVPVTAVITIVRHGETAGARATFSDGRSEKVDPSTVVDYISEERNPGNAKGVQVVELTVPSDLLACGMCLVDTPGIGSIFRQNTETTRAFLPHIDAALVVLGADPPISGEEAAIAEELAPAIPHLLFVLNKADRVAAADVEHAATFIREALASRIGREVELFCVSAAERLLGVPTREWPALTAALTTLARDAGVILVRSAEQRGVRRLALLLLREIEQHREALMRPVTETELRVASLRQTINAARLALSDLGYLLTAEQHRLSGLFEDERMCFLDASRQSAAGKLDEEVAARARRDAMFRAAERIANETVTSWLARIEPRAEELYRQATDRFVALARDFLSRVQFSDVDFDIEQHFRTRRGFHFTSLMALTGRPPGSSLIDRVRTPQQRHNRARREAHAYMRRLLDSNSARVANDLTDRVLESRRALEREIRGALDQALASSERALDRARAASREGSEVVAARLAALDGAKARISSIAA